MNILLIAGGWSSERDVALAGGKVVHQALVNLGHSVTAYDPATSLDGLAAAVAGKDFAFINLHGSPGEDGLIQAMLERMGCPYQGSGPAASMLALNKAVSKTFFRNAGLATGDSLLLTAKPAPDWSPALPFPLFIKANTGGSSLHMERVDSPTVLPAALNRLFALENAYLVESAIDGMEITCGVLEDLPGGPENAMALPLILIRPKSREGVFDYASKYSPDGAEEICPAPLPDALTRKVQDIALAAHRILGLSGYSRADFIVTPQDAPVLLEVNTLPGMTRTSLLPQEAAAVGLSFDQLIDRLVRLGLSRFGKA